MCIPIPAQVISLETGTAMVESDGSRVAVRCPQPDVKPGDWVLVYLGQVVENVSHEEAGAVRELLQALRVPFWAVHTANRPAVEGRT